MKTIENNINTRKAERRKLRFNSLDELEGDIDRIVAAEKAGTLRITGNWSVGKTFGHIAAWINYAYEGFPPGAHPPKIVRLIVRMMRNRILNNTMRPGMRIPRAEHGTFGVDEMSTDEGAKKLREAIGKLKRREPAKFDSPAFGPATDDERIAVTLRHAELHLGFLHP